MQEATSTMPQKEPEIGSTVAGRFLLRELIGDGGTARVFRADDLQSGHQVALKLLAARHRHEAHEYRLLDEGEYLRRIGTSKHVVGLVECGQAEDHDGWPFLVTELLEGRTLRQHELTQGLPANVAVSHARQIAAAVGDCHRANVVHRDLTPANLMVLGDPHEPGCTIRLFDFSHAGSAVGPRLPPGHPDRLTNEFEIIGTCPYIPPEQARAHPAVTAMDIYAFGVLLWELLMGENPFVAIGGPKEFITKQRGGGVPAPRMLASARIPEALAQLVNDCLVNDPKLRPNVSAVIERLDRLHAELASPQPVARPVTASDKVGASSAKELDAGEGKVAPREKTEAISSEQLARAHSGALAAASDAAEPVLARVSAASDKTDAISPEKLARVRSGLHVAASDKTDALSPEQLALARGEFGGPSEVVESPAPLAFAREDAPPINWHEPSPESESESDDDLDAVRSPMRKWVPVVLLSLLLLVAGVWWLGGGGGESSSPATAPTSGESEPGPSKAAAPIEPVPIVPTPSEPREADAESGEAESGEAESGEAKSDKAEPNTSGHSEKLDHRSPQCAKIRDDAAEAVSAQQWDKADRLTRRSGCWSSNTDRLRIRVKALAQSERYAECVRAGGTHKDKEIQKWVNICRRALP